MTEEELQAANEEIGDLETEIRELKSEILGLTQIVSELREIQRVTLAKLDTIQKTLQLLI